MRPRYALAMADRLPPSFAIVGSTVFTDLLDVTMDRAALDGTGTWVVVLPFDGEPICARFGRTDPAGTLTPGARPAWVGVDPSTWRSSLDEAGFRHGVETIRTAIADGLLDQVNLTRRLRAPLPPGADVAALGAALALGNPAPHAAIVRLPDHDIHIASASPERYLLRDGAHVTSSPIKGTAPTEAELLPKDHDESELVTEMVVDEFRSICLPETVTIPDRPRVEAHPGLVHLVSTVEGHLRPDLRWTDVFDATFPPASITGSPRSVAMGLVDHLEPESRGPYCGSIGWIDADHDRADLNVAIRTFWFEDGEINLGTGGGITAGSDPGIEWAETELKACRLLAVAAGVTP